MTEREAEEYLLDLELFGMRFGLDRMHKLMTVLGLPQRRFAQIHVVGTNGKTSTARFTARILREHGLRVGTYTSPHLRSFAERIEVDGEPTTGADFAAAVARVAEAVEVVERTLDEDDRVTQFEALTAAAYYELARRGVEVAVIEAGLGGRYDATNVIASSVQVLTSVGLEHTKWLGDTIAAIAEEKLAVVRDHATLVVGPDLHPDAMAVAKRVAAARYATLIQARAGDGAVPFQRRNFGVATAAAAAFLGTRIDDGAVARAAAAASVPGRVEVVGRDPLTIVDGAHNDEAMAALVEALPEVIGRRALIAVVSILKDKDAEGMLRHLLPHCRHVVFTRASNPRAIDTHTLEELAGDVPAEAVADPRAAVERARELAGPDGAVVVTGSIYLIADLVREPGAARASTL